MDQLPFVSGNGEIEIIKYSDKSAFIRGTAKNRSSTMAIKDRIKNELNASWNKFLKDPTNGGQTIAAWLIGQAQVQKAIDLVKQVGGGGATAAAVQNQNNNNNNNNNQQQPQAGNNDDDEDIPFAAQNNNNNVQEKPQQKFEKIVMDASFVFPILSADGQIELIKYSENVMAVRGIPTNPFATKSISEKLKSSFEAKYNGSLKEPNSANGATFCGWLIFPKHYEALKNFLQTEVNNTPAADLSKIKLVNDKPPAPALFTSADQKVKAIRYSEKAIAVNLNGLRDDVLYKHLTNDQEGGLGGKYLRTLTDPNNNSKFAGIIFGNGAKDKLKDFLTRYTVGSGKIPATRRNREGDEFE